MKRALYLDILNKLQFNSEKKILDNTKLKDIHKIAPQTCQGHDNKGTAEKQS